MSFEVVHAQQRAVEAEREGLAVGHAHEQRAHQSGTRGHHDAVELRQTDARIGQGPVHHRADGPDVGAARQLGDHAAEDPVHVL